MKKILHSQSKISYFFVGTLILAIMLVGNAHGVLWGVQAAFGYGGGGGGSGTIYKTTGEGIKVVINNGDANTNSTTVTLTLEGGFDAKQMKISNSSNFSGVALESYATSKTWELSEGDGEKKVYVIFYNQFGNPSLTATDTISLVSVQEPAQKADTNNDSSIDVIDFNTLMVNWGSTESNNPADLNSDGIVDVLDFNVLMVYWT